MDFRILGPVRAYADEALIPVGGPKRRALLAILLLHANEVVSQDQLIDALWGESPPAGELKALQVHVSQLRKALAGPPGPPEHVLIQTRAPGYVLELDGHSLDLHRFERLHEEGRAVLSSDPAEASRVLGEALELWRGPPLAEFAYEAFAQDEIARLDDLRIAAIEDRVEADLALGRHAGVVAPLEALVAKHPLRERLRGQLMLALYRSGRQSDALDSFRDARMALTEGLGIVPSRELRDLQQAILHQSPSLDHNPAPVTTASTPAQGIFVGRRRELAELESALDHAFAGNGRIVLVAGEPGIGKTRLADQLTARAKARGARVFVGRCWEAGGAPAFWPWVQSLRAYIREADPDALRTQLDGGAAGLAQILPDLRGIVPEIPMPRALESDGARFQLFEAVGSFLRNAGQAAPLVLVLDDLHAADEPSLLLLRYVVREIGGARLLVLCSFRDVDPAIGSPLRSAIADLVRAPQTTHVALAGLGESDVAEYIELATRTQPPSRLVEAIHSETGGNPFFFGEVVRLLEAEGTIADVDAELRLPRSVRAVVAQRVRRLSPPCQGVLALASVLGREFQIDALARLSELPRDELMEVMDEAFAERVIGEAPGSPGRLRFGHALIRDTLYDELTAARRLELHEAAGAALEAVYGLDLEPHLAEVAHHFLAAATPARAEKAAEYARRAGEVAASQFAYEEAARLFSIGLEVTADPTARCELLLALGEAHARAGDTPASKQALREAAETAEARGLADHLGRAALAYGGRLIWEKSRDDPQFLPLLERALDAVGEGDSPLRVKLLSRIAGGPLRDAGFPPARRLALSSEALAMARRIGDGATLAYALDAYIPANESPGNTHEMLELATELLGLATAAGDKEVALEAHEHCLGRFLELGEMAAAREALAHMTTLADELRQPAQLWLVKTCAARSALLEGRLASAERLIAEGLSAGRLASSSAIDAYRIQMYMLRREQGRLSEVHDLARSSMESYPTYGLWRCVLAQTAAALGCVEESRAVFDAIAVRGFAGLAFDEEWLVSLSLLAETASFLQDGERAALLYDLLLPYADRVAVTYPEISTGSVARGLGLLAAAQEHWHDAEALFDEAVSMNELIGARPWLARTRDDYGRTLLRRGRAQDRSRARALLATAAAR
jgi:DNA-binding SARP family transcriptional activator/RecA/RadA recombinase